MNKDVAVSNRIVYLDYLRVLATFLIVVIHVSAQNKYVVDVNSYTWKVFNVFDGLSRWAVSEFIMISGVLFLRRDVSIKRIYAKNVLRMLVIFAFWSVLYAVNDCGNDFGAAIYAVITGHYHMWFLLMITGLYILTPIMKQISEKEKVLKYFLILSLVFSVVVPQISTLINDFGNQKMIILNTAVNDSIKNMNMKMVLGYTGYFLLGFYLNNKEFSRYHRMVLYILGMVGILVTIVFDDMISTRSGVCVENYSVPLSIGVLLTSVAFFVLIKQLFYSSSICSKQFERMSTYCLGIYLVHPMIIDCLDKYIGLNTLVFNPVESVFIISVIVFLISFIMSAVMNAVPILNKVVR